MRRMGAGRDVDMPGKVLKNNQVGPGGAHTVRRQGGTTLRLSCQTPKHGRAEETEMRNTMMTGILLAGALAAGPALADARQEVVDAFTKAFSRGEYIAVITTDVKGRPYVMRMQVEWPNKFHMKNPDTEMVILPQGTWMNAAGRWMKVPMDMSKMIEGYSKEAVDQGLQGMVDVRETGSEDINGCTAKVYQYTATGQFMGVKNKSDVEVAVCGDSGYPVRLKTLEKGSGEAVSISYDFDANVDIRAPQ